MPHVIHGSERRPLVSGRLLYDEADQLSVIVPASCKRTGRCHECVVEIRAGGDQLSPRTDQEGFLGPTFRLACQATVERTERDVEFAVLRRRLRILLAPEAAGEAPEPDPAVSVVDGRFRGDDGSDLGVAMGSPVGVAIDVGTTTVVLELVDLETGAILAVAALENPQRFGGSDVMTRISYDDEVPGELRQALRRAINHELKRLCADLGVDRCPVRPVNGDGRVHAHARAANAAAQGPTCAVLTRVFASKPSDTERAHAAAKGSPAVRSTPSIACRPPARAARRQSTAALRSGSSPGAKGTPREVARSP